MTSQTNPEAAALGVLADRCEAATGADRELDAAIAVACGILFIGPEKYPGGGPRYYSKQADGSEWWPGNGGDQFVKPYTASLDAAMTLIPRWLTPTIIGHDREVRLLNGLGLKVGGDDYCSRAPTLSGAVCAAALRSRIASLAQATAPPPATP